MNVRRRLFQHLLTYYSRHAVVVRYYYYYWYVIMNNNIPCVKKKGGIVPAVWSLDKGVSLCKSTQSIAGLTIIFSHQGVLLPGCCFPALPIFLFSFFFVFLCWDRAQPRLAYSTPYTDMNSIIRTSDPCRESCTPLFIFSLSYFFQDGIFTAAQGLLRLRESRDTKINERNVPFPLALSLKHRRLF